MSKRKSPWNLGLKIPRAYLRTGGGIMYPRIRALREDNDLTQVKLAKILGMSRLVIQNMKLVRMIFPPLY